MAAAVDLDIIAVVAKNDENCVRFISEGFGKIDDIDLSILTPQAPRIGAQRLADPRRGGRYCPARRQDRRV